MLGFICLEAARLRHVVAARSLGHGAARRLHALLKFALPTLLGPRLGVFVNAALLVSLLLPRLLRTIRDLAWHVLVQTAWLLIL